MKLTARHIKIYWGEFDTPGRDNMRWGSAFFLVSTVFACIAWLILNWMPKATQSPLAPPAATMIDLAPLLAAPPVPVTELPPGPRHVVSQAPPPVPEVKQLPEAPPTPAPKIASPVPPKSKPEPVKHHKPQPQPKELKRLPDLKQEFQETTAPQSSQAQPAQAAAPVNAVPTPAPSTNAVPKWQSLLLGRLEQYKRYPLSAQEDGEQGVVYLRFSIDRQGHVLSASIAKSSGHADLDAETLALVHRAEPLPSPPSEIPGDPVTLTVPVQFYLNQT